MITPVELQTAIPHTEETAAFWKWVSALPKSHTLLDHQKDGQEDSCCQMAAFHLQKLAEGADCRSGVAGILKNATTFLKFGPNRPTFLCEAVDQRLHLDHGSMAAVIKRLLSYCHQVIDGSVQPISVSFLGLSTTENQEIWRDIFKGPCEDWIFRSIYYRECVGLISKSGRVSVWNFDHWMIGSQYGEIPKNGGVLAWRLDNGGPKLEKSLVDFDGTLISTALITDKFFVLPDQPPIDHVLISNGAEFSNDQLSIDKFLAANMTQLFNDQAFQVATVPTVFISGIYCNGENPGAGLGIARCLRQAFSNSIKLIGVDNSMDSAGLHDPIFDDIFIFESSSKHHAIDHFKSVLELLEKHPLSVYLSGEEIELRILAKCIADHCDQEISIRDHQNSVHDQSVQQYSVQGNDQKNSNQDHQWSQSDQPDQQEQNPLQNGTKSHIDHLYRRILLPSKHAIDQTTKPTMSILKNHLSNFHIPASIEQIDGESDDDFIERAQPFLHTCSFPVLVKSLYYGAIIAKNFPEVKSAVNRLRSHWNKSIYIQESIFGFEETIMLTAFEGKLLGQPVLMRKSMMTQMGKVWAATTSTVLPPGFHQQLTEIVAKLGWTGGAELEYIRTLDDQKYAIDWNMRFPSWVHGAALETENLPAALISEAFDHIFNLKLEIDQKLNDMQKSKRSGTGFIRTIMEIPWSFKIQPSILRGPEFFAHNIFGDTSYSRCQQHPSRQSSMAALLHKCIDQKSVNQKLPEITRNQTIKNISAPGTDFGDSEPGSNVGHPTNEKSMFTLPTPEETLKMRSTPCRYLSVSSISQILQEFKQIVTRAANIGTGGRLQPLVALSIKTQPDIQILQEALKNGYLADAISLAELQLALKSGYTTDQLILNGPCKFWIRGDLIDEKTANDHRFKAIFADSVSEFENYSHKLCTSGSVIGVRLAMPGTGTRFGIDISDTAAIDRLGKCLRALPDSVHIGFHFHYASSELGLKTWFNLCRMFVTTCQSIISMNRLKPDRVTLIDFGGGFVPISDHIRPQFEEGLTQLFALVACQLPHVTQVILEPGKTLSLKPVTLITRVLQIREPVQHQNRVDQSPVRAIVVDGCLGDGRLIPTQYRQAFSLSAASGGQWKMVDREGTDIILGRLCMEIDILFSHVQLPHDLKEGDYLAVTNAGAYESSAAYPFGEGFSCGNVVSAE